MTGRSRPRVRPRVRSVLAVAVVLGAMVTASSATTRTASMASLDVRSGSLSFTTSSVSVPRAVPTIAQVAAPGGPVATTTLSDTITISGGTANAAGTLTVRLWADAACSVAAAPAVPVAVAGADGVTYTASVTAPTVAATYRWTAAWPGDADNEPVATVCGAPGSTVTVTAGPAAALAFTTQPGGGRVGMAWAQQPVVAVRDAYGNAVPTATTVTLTIGANPGGGTLVCAADPVTASGGSAGFADCRIGVAGVGYTLLATSPGLAAATSVPFDVSAGVAFMATGPVTATNANVTATVAYPPGTAAGDLVLLVAVTANSAATTAPAGWTLLADQTAASGSDRLRLLVWWRPAAGETSVAVGLKGNPSGGSAWVVRYARPGGAGSGAAITTATATVPQGVAATGSTSRRRPTS